MLTLGCASLLLVASPGFAGQQKAASKVAMPKTVKVAMKDAQGKDIGTITVSAAKTGVQLALDLKGLTPGDHAIHIHPERGVRGPGIHYRRRSLQSREQETRA